MKQKANKYSSYFTPKIIIAIAIFLIVINKPLFAMTCINFSGILFAPIMVLGLAFPNYIEFMFANNRLFTTGTIGSIIIISMGIIYLTFPIVDYNARHLKISINKHEISRARFGSILLIISGLGLVLYFITIPNAFNLLMNSVRFEKIYFNSLLLLCIIGTILQKYDVSSLPLLHLISDDGCEISKKANRDIKYAGDLDKIQVKNLKNSIINWGILVKNAHVNSDDELEWEFLHIRNNIESFIHVLIWVCILIGTIDTFTINSDYVFSISFLCGFFLIAVCPNAIDTIRTKKSRLVTRLCSIVGITLIGVLFFILNYMNMAFMEMPFYILIVILVMAAFIGFIIILCLMVIYERVEELPFIHIKLV